MRHFRLLIVLAAAGCAESRGPWLEGPAEDLEAQLAPAVEGLPPDFDPALYEGVTTLDDGGGFGEAADLRPAAKTVDWPPGGTEEGFTFVQGAVVVDSILRHDADDFFGARVRVKNRTEKPVRIEWKIAFFDPLGDRKIGLRDFSGEREVWRAAMIEPLSHATLSNACRLRGASTFRLFVRNAGSRSAGRADGEVGVDSGDDDLLRELEGR